MQPVALELKSQEGSLPLLPPNLICTVSFAPQLPAPPPPSPGGSLGLQAILFKDSTRCWEQFAQGRK